MYACLETLVLKLTTVAPVCSHTCYKVILLLYQEVLCCRLVPVERYGKAVVEEDSIDTYVETRCCLPLYTVILYVTELYTHKAVLELNSLHIAAASIIVDSIVTHYIESCTELERVDGLDIEPRLR